MNRMSCPHCGTIFRVPAQARKSAPCPACQQIIDVSGVAIQDAILLDDPRDRRWSADRPRRRRRRASQDFGLTELGNIFRMLGGIALIGIGVIAFLVAVLSFVANINQAWAGGLALGPICCGAGYKTLIGE